jgi:hypothetical protein
MAKPRNPNLSDEPLHIKLFVDEKQRWDELWGRAKLEGVDRVDVLRFLLGLPERPKKSVTFFTNNDRVYFQTGVRKGGKSGRHSRLIPVAEDSPRQDSEPAKGQKVEARKQSLPKGSKGRAP